MIIITGTIKTLISQLDGAKIPWKIESSKIKDDGKEISVIGIKVEGFYKHSSVLILGFDDFGPDYKVGKAYLKEENLLVFGRYGLLLVISNHKDPLQALAELNYQEWNIYKHRLGIDEPDYRWILTLLEREILKVKQVNIYE